jgi:hypothetical protein
VTEAVENGDPRPGPLGRLAALGLGPDDVVLRREDREPGTLRRVLEVLAEAGHQGLRRGPVEREDGVGQGGVEARGDALGHRHRHPPVAEATSPVRAAAVEERRELLLPGTRRLPGPGELVPDVVRVEDPDGVADPAAQQVGAVHRDHDDRRAHLPSCARRRRPARRCAPARPPAIRADVDPESTAVAIVGQLRGVGLQLLLAGDTLDPAVLAPEMADQWRRALRADAP